MRLRNVTSVPDDVVREIIRFVCPSGIHGFDIRVGYFSQRAGTIKGRAYTRGSGYHDRAVPFVNLYVTNDDHRFPSAPQKPVSPGYLPQPYFVSPVEALVFLTAHELRHLWQAKVRKGYRVWGARGTFSERDCDAYALRLLRAWRRRG